MPGCMIWSGYRVHEDILFATGGSWSGGSPWRRVPACSRRRWWSGVGCYRAPAWTLDHGASVVAACAPAGSAGPQKVSPVSCFAHGCVDDAAAVPERAIRGTAWTDVDGMGRPRLCSPPFSPPWNPVVGDLQPAVPGAAHRHKWQGGIIPSRSLP